MAKVTFRLKGEDAPLTWSVPQEGVMAIKEGKGKKYINYYPGQDSIFTEDITNKDIKFSKVPDFTLNPLAKATELSFDDSDTALLNYLTSHPWHNKKWSVYSKSIEAKGKLQRFEQVEKALEYIKESEDIKIQAIALAVIGLHAFSKTPEECLSELKQKAFDNPQQIISACEADDYQHKYLAGLAFCSGIIKTNPTSTAVVWNDNKEGVIVHVAQGENGIEKLSEFLSRATPESEILLQEFQARLDKKLQNTDSNTNQSEIISEKDRKIAELEAKLEKQGETDTKNQEEDEASLEIKSVQEEYLKVVGTAIPNAYKKNLEWMRGKIAEAIKG